MWDLRTSNSVDVFVANSDYVSRRIEKTYRRSAHVIYPPVDVDTFSLNTGERDDYFIVVSRIVPYKRVSLIVEAFSRMPGRRLVVVGSGPGLRDCQKIAAPNVTFMGYQPTDRLRSLIGKARAFVFAAEEDFGISVVEAQACGTPVICYAKGGATETVVPDETGVMFQEQSVESICEAVDRFDSQERRFRPTRLRENAERFSVETFRHEFARLVASSWRAREHAKEARLNQAVAM
jgi:glycosyltransferase involved in cell wall biosynthesis